MRKNSVHRHRRALPLTRSIHGRNGGGHTGTRSPPRGHTSGAGGGSNALVLSRARFKATGLRSTTTQVSNSDRLDARRVLTSAILPLNYTIRYRCK